ncbi:hypothetical protein FGA82_05800 [Pseudomonas fluorescens]|uniref:hypothetical protein n=1 Tax=Pseudomonas fluorescens TaxID=294 RepID=UPI001130BC3F|nr:hypothetical protein [Pseudomonas fluorescens]TMU81693.1 hypothetical protein FGA82_05800 [Pseudomonas fluorescens]
MNDLEQLTQNDVGLDKGFADNGIYHLNHPVLGRQTILHDVKAQYCASVNRLYFTGRGFSGVTYPPYLLGCLKPDGTPDPDFGDNGITSGNFNERTESVGTSLTVLDDGKILLTGWVYGISAPALARFFANGKRDTGFGIDGYVILRRPASSTDQHLTGTTDKNASQDFSTSVTPLADGKILVVSTYVVTHQTDTLAYLFLLNSDGSFDTSFNGTGYVKVIYPGADPAQVKLHSAFVDQDGTFVVAGSLGSDPDRRVPLMARYARDGKLVPGFGTGGFFTPEQPLLTSAKFDTVIAQPNNRLLGIGSTSDGQGLLISLEADGKYNIQFNGAKPLLTRLGDNITSWRSGVMQPDGKIVLCGAIRPADESSPGVVARLLDNGSPDTTFHERGWISTGVDGVTNFNALTLQKDGKIVVAGFRYADENIQGLILRYHANLTTTQPSTSDNEGQLDPAFGTDGLALLNTSDTEGPSISPKGMGVDSTGRIYIVGSEHTSRERVSYWCMRMSASGVVDSTFGKAGYVTGEFDPNVGGRSYSGLKEVVELPGAKILLIGSYHDGSFATWVGLLRLLPDGRPDPAFGDKGQVLIALGSLSAKQKLRDESSLATSLTRSITQGPVLPDGKILVLTQIYDGLEKTQSVVLRFMPNGALDTSFNQSGMVRVAHPDYPHTALTDIVVDHEGKYALSGYCFEKSHLQFHALFSKLETTGALDTSFATAGFLLVEPNNDEQNLLFHNLVTQANRRLLGVGQEHSEGEHGLLVSRESDGSANIQFNRGEPLLTRLEDRSTRWVSAAIQNDASILVFGYLSDPPRTVVAKFTDRGELDKTLGAGTGWLHFNVMSGFSSAALLTDHSVLFIATVMVNDRRVSCVARGLLTTKSQTLNSAGKPDLEFGTDGAQTINIPNMPLARVSGVRIGPDNKIYCAGNSEDVTDPNPGYFLGRFNIDGSVDRSFGTSGFAQDVYPDTRLSQIRSFTFQPDGKIVIFSDVYNAESQLVPAFSRYDTQGRLDPSFGTDGQTVLDIELSPPGRTTSSDTFRKIDAGAAHPYGVEILPDGKILASHSYFFDFQQSHGLIIRLEKNGALDLSFNQIGYIPVIHPEYKLNATVLRNVIVQPDGKYLGCGNVYNDSGKPSPAMFVRYDSSGVLDKQFGDSGFVTVASAMHAHLIQATVLQPNQRILGFGDTLGNEGVMISLEPDGSPNIQFNRGNPLYTELEPGSITSWTGAAIQKNGRIVVAGGIGVQGQADIVVARFVDADLDQEFNDGKGWLRTHLENGVQLATGLALQKDGKVLICSTLPGRKIALLRYHG